MCSVPSKIYPSKLNTVLKNWWNAVDFNNYLKNYLYKSITSTSTTSKILQKTLFKSEEYNLSTENNLVIFGQPIVLWICEKYKY